MLQQRKLCLLAVVFFWAVGWVCISPAFGADEPVPLDSAASEDQPVSLLEDGDQPEVSEDAPISMGSFGEIDLHIKDLELAKVLQLLSLQSQRNIVASRNVSGTVSADLYGVDFYEALDAILATNGFGYREKGNFIYVYTAQELAEMEKAERKLTHRVIRLNYLTTKDAATYVAPLLSTNGSISASDDASAGFLPSTSDGGADSFAMEATLIVHDYPENVEEIVSMLQELDIRPKQVVVEATILEAKLNEDNAFGVDLSVVGDYSMANFADPLNVVDALISGNLVDGVGDEIDVGPYAGLGQGTGWQTTVGNVATGPSGFKVGIVTKHASAFLRALDQVQDTTVVATPKVVVLNRQRADLLSGAKLGYVSTTQSETSNTQTVEFLDIGVQLSLRPFVGEDNYVRMELKPSISDGSTQVVDGLVIPNTTNQEITTNVMVKSGQTIVLGGLFKEDTAVSRNQVPILGEVPLVGAAFKGQDDEVRRAETIFLITPTVVKDEMMYELGERVTDDIEVVRLGARQGLLPWSRTKLTASHMRQAAQYYEAGDTRQALWWANLALSMDSTIVSARKMKMEITGIDEFAPSRSILDSAIDEMITEQLIEPVEEEAFEDQVIIDGEQVSINESTEIDQQPQAEEIEAVDAVQETAEIEIDEVQNVDTVEEMADAETSEDAFVEVIGEESSELSDQPMSEDVEVEAIDSEAAEADTTEMIELTADTAEIDGVEAQGEETDALQEETSEVEQAAWTTPIEPLDSEAIDEQLDDMAVEDIDNFIEAETLEAETSTVDESWAWEDESEVEQAQPTEQLVEIDEVETDAAVESTDEQWAEAEAVETDETVESSDEQLVEADAAETDKAVESSDEQLVEADTVETDEAEATDDELAEVEAE